MVYLKLYEEFNSDAFMLWFGDSKMVDDNGKPRKFYHGVGRGGKFKTFDKNFISTSSGNYGHYGIGFYFTDSERSAKSFSRFFGGTGDVIAAYLKIENPFYVTEENLIKVGEKYNLNLPEKVDLNIDIDDLLTKLKDIDEIAHELLSLLNKYKDYRKAWDKLKSNHNGKIPESKIDLNMVSDWYEETIGGKYNGGVSDYAIEELNDIGIEPKIIRGYGEDIRMEYLTDLGQFAIDWTDSIKKEGHDGIIAGDEYVVFEPNQIKSINNKGSFSKKSNDIYENKNMPDSYFKPDIL